MKLYSLSRRDKFYNQIEPYQAGCAMRMPVVPGQTFQINGTLKFQTAPFTKNALSGARADLYLFYVPYRLVWNEWTDFIAQKDANAALPRPTAVPTTSVAFPLVFDNLGTTSQPTVSALPRRCFKLAYNEFFGGHDYYANVENDDGGVDTKRLHSTEQFARQMTRDNEVDPQTYTTSSGTPPNDVSIDLVEFARSMGNMRSAVRAQMSGDKYVDALRRMGVDPDWRIQNAPEFIGKGSLDLKPVKVFSTTEGAQAGEGVGVNTARYEGTIKISSKRVMTAEHGHIIGIWGLRPHLYRSKMKAPPDSQLINQKDYWMGDNISAYKQTGTTNNAIGLTDEAYCPQFYEFNTGAHVLGNNDSWVNVTGDESVNTIKYPDTGFPAQPTINPSIAFEAEYHTKGMTPIPRVMAGVT